MRPGEELPDTTNADKLFKCLGDFLLTKEGLLALYLGRTKKNDKVWAVNLIQYVLDLFIIYFSEYVATVPEVSEISPLFAGKWMPSKGKYNQISSGQLRVFIQQTLVDAGICDHEQAKRYSGYSTRPGLITGMKGAGIPNYSVAMWTRHASNAIERYDRPSPSLIIRNIQRVWRAARSARGNVNKDAMVKLWLKENAPASKEMADRAPEDVRGYASGLPAAALGAGEVLLIGAARAATIRKSTSGAPCDLTHDEQSIELFLRLQSLLPTSAGFFADRDAPLVTTLPMKDDAKKGRTKGILEIKPIRRTQRKDWLKEHPGSKMSDIINAKAIMLKKYHAAVSRLPLPGLLSPVTLALGLCPGDNATSVTLPQKLRKTPSITLKAVTECPASPISPAVPQDSPPPSPPPNRPWPIPDHIAQRSPPLWLKGVPPPPLPKHGMETIEFEWFHPSSDHLGLHEATYEVAPFRSSNSASSLKTNDVCNAKPQALSRAWRSEEPEGAATQEE